MEILNFLLFVFITVAPIAVGACVMLFSRQVTLQSLRMRQATLKIGFSDADVRIGQVIAVVIGAFLLFSGLIAAAQILFP